MKILFAALLLFGMVPVQAQYTVTFHVQNLPSYHHATDTIFIAGNFNDWKPDSTGFGTNTKNLTIKLPKGKYEYKFTRGSWQAGETDATSASVSNRTLTVESDTTIAVEILGWADHFPQQTRKSTASKNVHIVDTAFYMPQLNRHRRIWIYLPESYATSHKKYPVLYMHDGQNVFDDATSFAGEWGVDECIDTMKTKCIVVAIDNGLNKRLNEYCPYDFSLTGIGANASSNKGEGDQYVDFLVKNLKPFIDRHYRTLPDKKNTFIAGSSMGGLISLYAVLMYPEVFGGAGIFSPAFWTAPGINRLVLSKAKNINAKFFFYAGGNEGSSTIKDMQKVEKEIRENSTSSVHEIIDPAAKHNEDAWGKYFPVFYEWMVIGNGL